MSYAVWVIFINWSFVVNQHSSNAMVLKISPLDRFIVTFVRDYRKYKQKTGFLIY